VASPASPGKGASEEALPRKASRRGGHPPQSCESACLLIDVVGVLESYTTSEWGNLYR